MTIFTSLFYFIEAAKDNNFTTTAKRLYISQQTLSNHIKRLENYYHALLFKRKPSLSLTEAGQHLLAYADHMYTEDTNIRNSILDIEQANRGVLRIGASIPRAKAIMPKILPTFCAEFPNVQIQYMDNLSSSLLEQIETCKLDIAVGIFPKIRSTICAKKLMKDKVFLVATDQLLVRYYGNDILDKKIEGLKGIHVDELQDLPLVYPSPSNQLRQNLDECYNQAGCEPKILFHTQYPQFFFQLCLDSIAASYVTQMSLLADYHMIKHPINAFPLMSNNNFVSREVSIIWNTKTHLTKYAQYCIDLIVHFFENSVNIVPFR